MQVNLSSSDSYQESIEIKFIDQQTERDRELFFQKNFFQSAFLSFDETHTDRRAHRDTHTQQQKRGGIRNSISVSIYPDALKINHK